MARATHAGWLNRHRKPLVLSVLTVIAYLAAINRAQAFPWATAALLSAVLLTGFTWPHWLVKQLTVTRTGPLRAEEGETIHFNIDVRNHGWLPRFMVELVDRLPFVEPDQPPGDRTLGLLAYLPARQDSQVTVAVRCEKRGYYRLGPVGLASSFPLGLAEARKSHNDGLQTLTVYPDIFNIINLPLRGAPSQIHRGGYLLPEGGGAAEFSGLREYRRGDNPRHIHWPSSARLNELIVREYEPLASACIYIALNQSAMDHHGRGKASTFEYAVRIAGSIARYACLQNIRTRLAGNGRIAPHIATGSGDAHYRLVLDQLAVVDIDGTLPYADLLQDIGTQCLRGETIVVFLTDDIAGNNPLLLALNTLRARQVNIFAILFERASFSGDAAASPRRPSQSASLGGTLLELGAHLVNVRCDDDLVSLFNP